MSIDPKKFNRYHIYFLLLLSSHCREIPSYKVVKVQSNIDDVTFIDDATFSYTDALNGRIFDVKLSPSFCQRKIKTLVQIIWCTFILLQDIKNKSISLCTFFLCFVLETKYFK